MKTRPTNTSTNVSDPPPPPKGMQIRRLLRPANITTQLSSFIDLSRLQTPAPTSIKNHSGFFSPRVSIDDKMIRELDAPVVQQALR